MSEEIRLGFSGSRRWKQPAIAKGVVIDHALEKISLWVAEKRPLSIHVGDAHGVDQWIVQLAMNNFPSIPLTIYGINNKCRNFPELIEANIQYPNVRYANGYVGPYHNDAFVIRYKFMVDQVTHLICYWDGSSSGTKHTFDYALEQEKKIMLCQPVWQIAMNAQNFYWSSLSMEEKSNVEDYKRALGDNSDRRL